jgi:hypothetical protein
MSYQPTLKTVSVLVGGPNGKWEFAIWTDLQDREWTTITCKRSYASVLKNPPVRRSQMRSVFQRLRFPAAYQNNFSEEISDTAVSGKADLRSSSIFYRLDYHHRQPYQPYSRQLVDPVNHGARDTRVHRKAVVSNSKFECNLGAGSNLKGKGLAGTDFLHVDGQLNHASQCTNLGRGRRQFLGSCFKCLGWGHTRDACSSPVRCKSCFIGYCVIVWHV